MSITLLSLIGFLTRLVGGLAIVFGLRTASGAEMERRLRDYVIEPTQSTEQRAAQLAIRRTELRGSFAARAILPGFRGLGRFFGRFTPAGSIAAIDRQLEIANYPLRLGAREFYGIRVVFIAFGVVLAYMLLQRGNPPLNYIMAPVTLLVMYQLPRSWLRSLVRRRQDQIRRNLPDALDMLSVCADAGLGFDQSLQRVSENWKTPLGLELARVVKEMNLGSSRAQAMRAMANRLDIVELSSFVSVILQSDQLGMSIADVLHAQANQMRIERRHWAQEQARKIPVKMLFPMVFLILPALFLIILGPALPAIREVFSGL
jgi:tight adherence protein C